jgi:hypothetical protein
LSLSLFEKGGRKKDYYKTFTAIVQHAACETRSGGFTKRLQRHDACNKILDHTLSVV